MQHKVPQYIEIEDKIFGPFTAKQFSYLAFGFGLCIILWRIFEGSSFLIFMLAPVIALSLALAFVKPNGKPFVYILQNLIFFLIRPRKLFWRSPGSEESRQNVFSAKAARDTENKKNVGITQKKFSSTQIKNLANRLDK